VSGSPHDQPQVGLVDQGGGPERLARILVGQARRGNLPQFVVDERKQLCGGLWVAGLDRCQDLRDIGHTGEFMPGPLVRTHKYSRSSITGRFRTLHAWVGQLQLAGDQTAAAKSQESKQCAASNRS
jgi:hypothetical protein